MVPGRLKSAMAKSAETVAAIVLVLVFFAIILGMMQTFFPLGTGFQDLMRGDKGAARGGAGGRDILVSGPGADGHLGDASSVVATLSTTQQTVKSKQADAIAWRDAQAGMALRDRDAVQTQKGATAVIAFDENNRLQLGENSLVVIRRMESDPILRGRRAFSMAVDGELSGTLTASSGDAIHLEVATPNGVARLSSTAAARGETDFKITVNPDNTSTLAVFSGMAELLTASGKALRIEANQAATISDAGVATRAITPPKAPLPTAPGDASVYYYRDLAPQVQFRWDTKEKTERFHFSLARDPAFGNIVISTTLAEKHYTHGNLKPGKYYWRVSGLTSLAESPPSAARAFELVRDTDPPLLSVEFPPAITTESKQRVRGHTEPGARLLIAGKPVTPRADGDFEYELELESGSNVLVVQALDPAGNVSFRSQLVQGRFP